MAEKGGLNSLLSNLKTSLIVPQPSSLRASIYGFLFGTCVSLIGGYYLFQKNAVRSIEETVLKNLNAIKASTEQIQAQNQAISKNSINIQQLKDSSAPKSMYHDLREEFRGYQEVQASKELEMKNRLLEIENQIGSIKELLVLNRK